MKLYPNYCFACLFWFLPYSQIKGKCVDAAKEFPVNISVKGKAIGTVSNLKDTFL
jgi:hypothetical protein